MMKAMKKLVAGTILFSLCMIAVSAVASLEKAYGIDSGYGDNKGTHTRETGFSGNRVDLRNMPVPIERHLVLLKKLEDIVHRLYATEIELKEELEKSRKNAPRINHLINDVYHLELHFDQLTSSCRHIVDQLFPKLSSEFIGRGPIFGSWKFKQ